MPDPTPPSGRILPNKPWANEAWSPRPWRLLARLAAPLIALTQPSVTRRARHEKPGRTSPVVPYSEQVLMQTWPVRENARVVMLPGFDRPTGED